MSRATTKTTTVITLACCALAGCDFGKKNVVFVTNTTAGVDLEAAPTMKTSIGYDRFEGVIEPQFENGRLLPVVSSINTTAGISTFGSGHSFGTGAASIVLAEGLTMPGYYFGTAGQSVDDLKPTAAGTFATYDPKTASFGRDAVMTELPWRDRERVVFTTITNLALAVEWQQQVPTAINLGYKRKEFAYAPLGETFKDPNSQSGVRAVTLPSLLATANVGASMAKVDDTKIDVGQLFATGPSATYLAAAPEVRQVMAARLVQGYAQWKMTHQTIKATRDNIVALYKSNSAKRSAYYDLALKAQLLDPTNKLTSAGGTALAPDDFDSQLTNHIQVNDQTRQQFEKLLADMNAA